MRVLITVWPATSHLFPAIPLASALLGAGHDVCFAAPPSLAPVITAAGFGVVPLGGDDGPADFEPMSEETSARYASALGITTPEDAHRWEMFSVFLLTAIGMYHPVGDGGRVPVVDDLVDFVRAWRPDLVLWDTWPASAVAARLTGAAHARLLWGPDLPAWFQTLAAQRRAELTAAGLSNPLADVVRPVADRYGVEVDDELLLGDWAIDPTPAEMRLPVHTRSVGMRWVPYTGGAVLPDWVYPRPERPRVVITLGTTAQMFDYTNTTMVERMLDMVAGLDVDVIATLNSAQLKGMQLPDNVRAVDYVPLNQILPTCSALIHHGGFGSFAAAVAHGVPQLIEMAAGVESPEYARYLTEHGAGLTLDHEEQTVTEMRKQLARVLDEPGFREGTARLRADWLAMPSPNDVVAVLEKLTAHHRTRA